MAATSTVPALSETQLRILHLLAGRWTNGRIAEELGLSAATVKWNVSQLLAVLGLERREDAGDWWSARHGVRPRAWRDRTWSHPGGTQVQGAVVSKTGTPFEAKGSGLAIEEWQGSAPGELHVHHNDDIAWHVIEGSLRFKLTVGETNVNAGETIFFPAGTAHSYGEGEARYLVIAPPRLFELFHALRTARMGRPHTDWGNGPDAGIYGRFDSELLDRPGVRG